MLFNSLGYIVFLLIAVVAIWLLPSRAKVYAIAIFSILFYGMWRWEFVSLILFSATIDFFAAKLIFQTKEKRRRQLLLGISLLSNLGLLVFFKYTFFIYGSFDSILNVFNLSLPNISGLSIILPLGISFYTFQTISYTIDVYRGVSEPTKNFGVFFAYVSFWPQLVAGPILRANEIIPQLENPKQRSLSDLSYGLQRIIIGLFKKVVIADNLAYIVNDIFLKDFTHFNGPDVWVAAFLFGFQIYFDFAGYSDIAIGSARLIGISLPENFNWPYMARSPKEFWGRWHISLSSWIRDYLYLPLTNQPFRTKSTEGIAIAAEEPDKKRSAYPLFLTWFIMGLWHGAGWTFALWGVYHAVFIYFFRKLKILRALPEKMPILSWAMTLLVSMLSWIPFRAQSLHDTFTLFSKVFNPFAYNLSAYDLNVRYYLTAGLLTVLMIIAYLINNSYMTNRSMNIGYQFVKAVIMAIIVALVLIYLRPVQQFIYFQF